MFDFFKKIKESLTRTREKIQESVINLFSKSSISPEDWDRLEADLYHADFGPQVVEFILERMRSIAKADRKLEGTKVLRQVLLELLQGAEGRLDETSKPQVALLLGVNGAGKTTTVAKLAHQFQQQGSKVLLGSCDTFRAAADQQLKRWAERLHLDCVGSHQGADAAAVSFDVCQAGIHRQCDWVFIDTAGRLHNKSNLMEELKKMLRVLKKCNENFPQHRWLVVDGSLGTNSIAQAKLFHEAVGLTGIIVTKLDGTSKGGTLVGIYHTLHLPIYFVGLGEGPDDLQLFSTQAYVNAIVGTDSEK